MKSSIFHNKNKYCHFHIDHGHDIDDCHKLKREIEEHIRHVYLRKYVHRGAQPSTQSLSQQSIQVEIDNQVIEEQVGMIS